MPAVATGATEAVLSTWNIEPGTDFSEGDVIVTVETDKAVVDVEAEKTGRLIVCLAEPGSTVEVGSPIALLTSRGEVVNDVAATLAALGFRATPHDEVAIEEATTADSTAATAAAVTPAPGAGRLFASPLARKIARDTGVGLDALTGTGPGGRIRRRDVVAYVASRETITPVPSPGPAPPVSVPVTAPAGDLPAIGSAGFRDEPLSRMRSAIATRLAQSQREAPHFYLRGTASVDRLLSLRQEINAGGGTRVSVNDMIVKAVGKAHTIVPELNVAWNGDSIRHFDAVDVAVAVATDYGLVTPVVRGVDRLTVTDVACITQDLISRAKDRRLKDAELAGGAVSISNLGMFGIEEFAAIINPPQAAILAVGAARECAVVRSSELGVATQMTVTMSVDHRSIDGATAARWMQAFLGLIEGPISILA